MKKMLFLMMLSLVNYSYANQNVQDTLPTDIRDALLIFKSNLIKNENFAQILSTMTNEIRTDFNDMIDDMWSFFCKMQTYCIEHIKENPLFEKYKQYMQKNSIKGSIICSIEDKDQIEHERLSRYTTEDELNQALQPFYETLSEKDAADCKRIMDNLCLFFDELRLEYEQMLTKYSSVEDAFAKTLEASNKTLRIECGLEYPFPTLAYYID